MKNSKMDACLMKKIIEENFILEFNNNNIYNMIKKSVEIYYYES